jgi:hypothetical protein
MRSPLPYLCTSICVFSLLGVIAPASVKATPVNSYPKPVVRGFIDGCITSGRNNDPNLMAQLCSCAIQNIQETYTLEQFVAIGRKSRSSKIPPKEIIQVTNICVKAVLKANS